MWKHKHPVDQLPKVQNLTMNPVTASIEDTLNNLPEDIREECISAIRNKRNNAFRNNLSNSSQNTYSGYQGSNNGQSSNRNKSQKKKNKNYSYSYSYYNKLESRLVFLGHTVKGLASRVVLLCAAFCAAHRLQYLKYYLKCIKCLNDENINDLNGENIDDLNGENIDDLNGENIDNLNGENIDDYFGLRGLRDDKCFLKCLNGIIKVERIIFKFLWNKKWDG
jgi:hypothetical protein